VNTWLLEVRKRGAAGFGLHRAGRSVEWRRSDPCTAWADCPVHFTTTRTTRE